MDSRKELALEYLTRRPDAAARVLEQQTIEQSVTLLAELPIRVVAPVIKAMMPHYAFQCLTRFSIEHAAGLIQQLSTHRGASLLRGLSQRHRDAVLAQLSQTKASSLRFLLSQGNNVVGGWLDQHPFTLPPTIPVAEARQRLQRWESIDAQRLFVVGEESHLHGAVPLSRLLQAGDQQRVKDLVEPVKALRMRASLYVAEQHTDWFDHIEMPVIDRHNEFVGIITYRVLNRGLKSLRRTQTETPDAKASFNTLTDVFLNSFHYTWQSWIDLLSIPAEHQGVEREQSTGRNRNT